MTEFYGVRDKKLMAEQYAKISELYWLQRDDRFQAVKRAFLENRVAILHHSLSDPMLVKTISPLSGKFSVIYVSNVDEWLKADVIEQRGLDYNLRSLLRADAKVIKSTPNSENKELTLSMGFYKASEYLLSNYDTLCDGAFYWVRSRAISSSVWGSTPVEFVPEWIENQSLAKPL
jgi:hypothetical protein